MKERKFSSADKMARNTQKQRAEGSSYGYLKLPNGIKMFKVEGKKKYYFDILPYKITDKAHLDRDEEVDLAVPGTEWYKKPIRIHRNIGVETETVICPTTIGKKCPICEEYARKKRDPGESSKEEVDALKYTLRNLYVVLPRDENGVGGDLCIWDMSQYLFQNLLNDEIEEKLHAYTDFYDLVKGKTLNVRFEEKSLSSNKFANATRIDLIPRRKRITPEIIKNIPNLDDMLTVMTYKQLEAKFLEIADIEESDNEENEGITRKEMEEALFDTQEYTLKQLKKMTDEEVQEAYDELGSNPVNSNAEDISREDMEEALIDSENYTAKQLRKMTDEEVQEAYDELGSDSDNSNTEVISREDMEQVLIDAEEYTAKQLSKMDDNEVTEAYTEYTEPESEPEPVRRRNIPSGKNNARQATTKPGKGKCPHGLKFGVDTDTSDKCNKCKIWDACIEAKEENE